MGLLGRIVTAVVATAVGLFVCLVVLAIVLASCGSEDEEPRTPSTSSTPARTSDSAEPTPTDSATATVTVTPPPRPPETVTTTAEPSLEETTEESPTDSDVYYENCDAAREAGAAPVHSGDPGYGPHLDRDGDGVACEPYVGP
ncbi:excalibur calcium-binding domain-containing protein [Streptomyces sp. IB201691-2A2]|nr:excalibur calcium-binding domain-containing protein [Streptomyces sp. IB201691-2A2]